MSKLQESLYSHAPVWLQNSMVTAYGAKIHLKRYGRTFRRGMREFERNQWLSVEELVDLQNEKLRKLIEHVYRNVPYYRQLMKKGNLRPDDIRNVDDLHKLPVLKRTDLKNNLENLIDSNFPRRRLEVGHTSGTTGSPLTVLWDRRMGVINNIVDWRQKHWAGLKYGDRIALAVGRVVVPLSQKNAPFWRTNWIHNQLFLSSFHMQEQNLSLYIDKLKDFRPKALEAYPSTAYILARYLDRKNEVIPLTCVLTSSETLYPHYREVIQRVFNCEIFDFFGMAERVIFATECPEHQGHHLNMDYGITEILKANTQQAKPGEMGRIVATGLHNFAAPLIRYETDDVTALKKEECACGRKFPLIEDITTKAEDIITTKDGRYISSSVLTHPFKPIHHIIESQIIQEDREHIHIKIVKDRDYSDQDTNALLNGLHERLGKEMKIGIEFVDLIPRTKSGKFRWVISKVPLEI